MKLVRPEELKELEKYIISERRYLHMHPEVGFAVADTHDHIANELDKLGIIVHRHVGLNSVVGVIENKKGPTLGLRADTDALPLEELNEVVYKSKNLGKMHACGHDAHTAMLLGAAKYLVNNKDKWHGTLKLFFQEAEEGPHPGGAKGIIDSGLVDDVDSVFALHVSPEYPTGTFAIKEGVAFASASTFRIYLRGKGCHGAYPQLGINPLTIQAEVVKNIQKIVFEKLPPRDKAAISVTQVHGGTTHNIIPDDVFLEGTIRCFSSSAKALIKAEFERILQAASKKHGNTYEFQFIEDYDALINTADAFSRFQNTVTSLFGERAFKELENPTMVGEDFFRYINKAKSGAICWLGTKNDENTGNSLHSPRFNIDESALVKGVVVLINLITNYKRSE
ncbi:MAG: amidohydrolase [Acholeplasmataceae bacterium]|nr:amidohydrolase [Acholeplasmataceae bacterium]